MAMGDALPHDLRGPLRVDRGSIRELFHQSGGRRGDPAPAPTRPGGAGVPGRPDGSGRVHRGGIAMIYTFYSYKGGVGRSMAVANVADWFSRQGLRVVMID